MFAGTEKGMYCVWCMGEIEYGPGVEDKRSVWA